MRSFGVVGPANGAKALRDKHRDVGVSLGDCSEHLPTSARSFDIADANLQVTFALFALRMNVESTLDQVLASLADEATR